MANPNRVVGRAKVKIDGALLPTAGDTVLTPGGVMREGVEGDYEAGAFRESTKPSKIEFSVLAKASFDPIAFGKHEDVTVDVQYDTGQHFVIRHAWAETAPDMSSSDGKGKCALNGPPAEKVQ